MTDHNRTEWDIGRAIAEAMAATPMRQEPLNKSGRLVISAALLKGAQLGMFGAPASGKKSKVKQHLRRTKQGQTLVTEHERTGREAKEEDEPEPKAKPAAPPFEPQKPKLELKAEGEHQDVGPTVWGARKHKWRVKDGVNLENLDDLEDAGEGKALKYVTKKHVGIKHDVDADMGNGSSPGASFMKKKLIAAIASGPQSDIRHIRQWFVQGWDWLQHELDGLHTVDQFTEFMADWEDMFMGQKVAEEVNTGMELWEKFGKEDGWLIVNLLEPAEQAELSILKTAYWGRATGRDKTEETKAERERREYLDPRTTMRLDRDAMKKAGLETRGMRRVTNEDGHVIGYRVYRPLPEDENPFKGYLFALGGMSERTTRREIRSNRLARMVMRTGVIREKYLPQARQMEKDDDWTELTTKKASGKKSKPWRRAVVGNTRVGGPEVATGNMGNDLQETFGLKHIQHGSTVTQSHRGGHIDLTMAAFADLADIMGIDPKMIAHGGRLSLAFGARGGGAAGAHYEPAAKLLDPDTGEEQLDPATGEVLKVPIINLTNTRGNGSLAHEWAHFFDHQLTSDPTDWVVEGPRKSRAPFISHKEGQGALHPDVAVAYNGVMDAIMSRVAPKETKAQDYSELNAQISAHNVKARKKAGTDGGYASHAEQNAAYTELRAAHKARLATRRHARKHGNSSDYHTAASQLGEYWQRPHELFARAFESFIEDELESKGRMNTYLVAGTAVKYNLTRAKGNNLEPYPQGAERKRIHAAFRVLTASMAQHSSLEKALRRAMLLVPDADPWS